MKFTLSIILLFTFGLCLAQPKPFKPTAAQTSALKKQADDMAVATLHQDYKRILYYTYPPVIKAMGGPDKMSEQFLTAMGQMQAQGIVVKSLTAGDIKPIVKSGGDLYSIVSDIIQVSANGTIITRSVSAIAISHNNGVKWYFVDSAPLKNKNLKKFFPTFPDGLVIPETGKGPGM